MMVDTRMAIVRERTSWPRNCSFAPVKVESTIEPTRTVPILLKSDMIGTPWARCIAGCIVPRSFPEVSAIIRPLASATAIRSDSKALIVE